MSGTARITPLSAPPDIGIGQGLNTQGMISPANAFVDMPGGTLNAVSFRFLFSLLQQINVLQREITTLNTRLQSANIP